MTRRRLPLAIAAALTLAWPVAAQAPRSEILVAAERVFPQGLAAAADGSVFVGSLGQPVIYRAGPGASVAQRWIRLDGPGTVYSVGLAADEAASTLWACVVRETEGDGVRLRQTALAAFELTSGKAKASYPLPDGASVCHDVAVGPDGAVYVTDPALGRVMRLRRGAAALQTWLADASLEGVSGATFLGEDIYLCTARGRLFRIMIDSRGDALGRIEMITSRPLSQPDGLRAQGGALFVAETGAGRVSQLTLGGQYATVRVIGERLAAPTALAPGPGKLWVAEAKLAFQLDPALRSADPGDFKAYAIPLP